MYALMLCVAVAAVGTEVGWQRMPEGGMEYIIQLDPQTLEALRAGEAIQSDIPPAAGEVRSYRIVLGNRKLPRETPPAPTAPPKVPEPSRPDAQDPLPTVPQTLPLDAGSKRLAEQPAIYMKSDTTAASQPKPTPDSQPETSGKPWLPLTFTLLGLFASIGANVYLGWIAWDCRQQFRTTRGEKPSGEH